MIALEFVQAQISVGRAGENKLLVIQDPDSGIQVKARLTPEAARTIGAALSTGLVVASSPLPPDHGPQ